MQDSQYSFSQQSLSNISCPVPHSWPSPFYEQALGEIRLSRQLTFLDFRRNRMKGGNVIGEFQKGEPITPIELINLRENEQGFGNPIIVMDGNNVLENEDIENLSMYKSSKSNDVFLSCNQYVNQPRDIKQQIKQSLYEENQRRWEEIGFTPRKR